MATITDVVVTIHPASDEVGALLRDNVWVLFDREIDETSVNEGNFFVEGPDTDSVIGPDIGLHLPNISDSTSDDQFISPGYAGIVQGTITYKRINLSDTDEYTGPDDTDGDGNLWRTQATFTPTLPFQALTVYRVYLAGDEAENNAYPTGVKSRTIFDEVPDPGNTGTGVLEFSGSYTGAIEEVYHIVVTIDGAAGTAWYEWFTDTDPTPRGPYQTNAHHTHLIEKGIYVDFDDGNFEVDDAYTVVVKPAEVFTDNTYWSFTTGTGSIQTLPESTSTSIIGDPLPLVPTTLSVVSITPKDRASNLPITTNRITINFSANIDSDTVTDETVTLVGAPVNGDENLFEQVSLVKNLTVTNKKIIIDI